METICDHPGIVSSILEHISSSEIYAISCVCRRLHDVFLAIFLQNHGCLTPYDQCDVILDNDTETLEFDALAALKSARFVLPSNVKRLTLVFTGVENLFQMTANMHRCISLLQKFRLICDITIDLQAIKYDSKFLLNGQRENSLKSVFLDLLVAIADVPSVASIRVATGWTFGGTYMLEAFPFVDQKTSPTSLLTKYILPTGPGNHPTTRRLATSHNSLRTFLIDSPILVLPTFYALTLSILRSRPITTLRLHMLLAPADWAVILPTIIDAVPRLTELTILGIQIDIAELLRPIATLKHLESLTLDSAVDFSRASFRTISTFSPESAIAASSFIPFFSMRKSIRLSNLTTLVARPEHVYMLLRVHKALPSLTSLCIRLELLELVSQATLRVMGRTISRLLETNHKVPLTLDIRADMSAEHLMCRALDIALAQEPIWDGAFASIEHMKLRHYADNSLDVLSRWLSLFAGLRTFSWVGRGLDSPKSSVGFLMAELRRTSPKIHTIIVRDVAIEPSPTAIRPPQKTGFLDLPDDVLLMVFAHLDSELYSVSRMTKRLHLLALPIYFSQNGIDDPTTSCNFGLVNHPTGGDILSALNSALFLDQIKAVSCQLHSWGGSIACYLYNIERLTVFLEKFPSVTEVSLYLSDLANVHGEINEMVAQKWCRAVGRLLNVIHERSCTSLTIQGSPYLRPDATAPPWPRGELTLDLSPLARTHSALRSFSFHPTFSRPTGAAGLRTYHGGIRWTLSALRCSQITTLSVSIAPDMSPLLELIGLELLHVSDLEVLACDKNLHRDLLALLCALLSLTRLSLPLVPKFRTTCVKLSAAGSLRRSSPS
ncbi:hypothetical protein C8J57DRAFT_175252 [Mycena rebaudengoi]|nr:hypothetical protein C8J57DRAFT_175252 [Mycena rebaudengoi]